MKDLAVFICTHGRPDKQITYNWLKEHNCTYPVYLLVDSLDSTQEEYKRMFGDSVIVFDKPKYIICTDVVVPVDSHAGVVFARNAAIDIAHKMGYKYVLACDDDCTQFTYRYAEDGHLRSYEFENADDMISVITDFMDSSDIETLSLTERGNYFGGVHSPNITEGLMRTRLCCVWFIRTDTETRFSSLMVEDLVYYRKYNAMGHKIFRLGQICFSTDKHGSASNNEGMAKVYNHLGAHSYIPPLVVTPICTLVRTTREATAKTYGVYTTRLHYNYDMPKIISSAYKQVAN